MRLLRSTWRWSEGKLQQQLGRDKDPRFNRYHSSEPATAHLISALSSITGPRGDEGDEGDERNSCCAEWVGCCDKEMKTSRMTSYRSNWSNSYNEGAVATIHHHAGLRRFFGDGFLGHYNLRTESTAADIKDDSLPSLVRAITTLCIKMTGPFWNLLESHTKYTELQICVLRMENYLDHWWEHASLLLGQHFPGVFNGEFEMKTEMVAAMDPFVSIHSAQIRSAVELKMRHLVITGKQLDFLPPDNACWGQAQNQSWENIS